MKKDTLETKMRTYLKGSFMEYWDDLKNGRDTEYTSRVYFAQSEMFQAMFPKVDMEKLETRWQNEYKKMMA